MTLRDADRFKDRIELSLDNRQIFFLFFGAATVACLVFVLGVMVGRRLEGREALTARAPSTTVDPLAALDELGAEEDLDDAAGDELAFPAALAGEPAQRDRPLGAADVAPAAPPPEPAPAPRAAAPAPAPAAPPPAQAQSASTAGKSAAPRLKGKFTLQISSFQDKGEADALVSRLAAAGYRPYVVVSNVPDKGVYFRVRLGDYPDHDAAMAGKMEFEKKQHIIAYVTRI